MAELLPCPFCGEEVSVFNYCGWWVSHWCETLGRYIDTRPFFTKAIAIEAWNTRAERTCRITSEEYDDLLDMFTTHFSCGHYGIGMARWFKHCPECGAKVVTE